MLGYIRRVIFPFLIAVGTVIGVFFLIVHFDLLSMLDGEPKQEEIVEVYEFEDPVQVGDFRYVFDDVVRAKEIVGRDGSSVVSDDGQEYVMVTFFVKNKHDELRSISASMFTLYDEENRPYKPIEGVSLDDGVYDTPFVLFNENDGVSSFLLFSVPSEKEVVSLDVNVNNGYEEDKPSLLERIKGEGGVDPFASKNIVLN